MTKIIGAVVALLLLVAAPAYPQVAPDTDPGRAERTREDLERLLAFYENVAGSPGYSQRVREMARDDVARIRSRLTEGDFRPGDRIALYVQGEPDLPDTVTVEAGPMFTLPLFGDVGLRGVLRSEIEPHVTAYLSSFIRGPVVRARALMRVSIQGAVRQPGFYHVPADMLVGETLMVAGGVTEAADLDKMIIERGQDVLIGDEQMQSAVQEGLTLDQLNLRAGDQIVLPASSGGFLTNLGLVTGILGSVTFLVIQFAR